MAETVENRTSKSGNRLILVISLAIAGLFLFLALQGLDWQTFARTLQTGIYGYLPVIFVLGSLAYAIRAIRWKMFLNAGAGLRVLDVFWANMVGYLGNAYLPARAGEVLRSVFLGKKSGLGTSFVLATALTERILDVIALVLIGSSALLQQANIELFAPLLANAVRVMAVAGAVGLIVIIAIPFQEALILRIVARAPLPAQIKTAISLQISRFLIGMRCLQSWRRLFSFILLTGLIWLTDAIGVMAGVRIISQTIGIWQAFILLSALGLSSAIPSTPGYVGVYQFVAVTVLQPFGFSRSEALAYIIIGQVANYGVVTFWGLLGLWRLNRNKPNPDRLEDEKNN